MSGRVLLIALVLAGAGTWGFFHLRKASLESRLGDVATVLAHRDVRVHCQAFAGNLLDVGAEAGTVRFDADGRPADVTDLKRPICRALDRFDEDVRSAAYGCVLAAADCPRRIFEDVVAVQTLAHEAWHLRGIGEEGRTECYAYQTNAQAAMLLGADATAAQRTAEYAFERIFPNLPDEYRSPGCANGGPLDLRPADPAWP